MDKKNLRTLRIYRFAAELTRIGNKAIEKVRKENKALNLPLVYSKNGRIYYELPDGRIVTEYEYK